MTAVDFASLFRRDLEGRTVYVTKFSSKILNPNYWEGATPAAEAEVRAKTGGAIFKEEAGARFVWRSDHVPKGRKLVDGIGLDPELVSGSVLVLPGSDLAKFAEAIQPYRDDLQFGLVESTGNHMAERAAQVATDIRTLRLGPETLICSSRENSIAQFVFSTREQLFKALEGAIRGYAHRVSKKHVAHINHDILDFMVRLLDKTGALSYPHRDLIVKDTHLEMTLHLAKSEWPAEEGKAERRALVYYERTAGIWAVTL